MAKNKSKGQKLEDKLAYKRKNFWNKADAELKKEALAFSLKYRDFLNKGKTERLVVKNTTHILKKYGFTEFTSSAQKGDSKLFKTNRKKNVAIARMGKKDISEGFKLIVSHIDSPRIDIKQMPVFEDTNADVALLYTHYYGGIKKYQWMAIPLALYGTIVKENGETVDVAIGDKAEDPVFTFSDLLPHLSAKQYKKKMKDAIDAQKLRLTFGSIPYPDEDVKKKIKLQCLKILNEQYGIKEEDFISAELELVPAFPARDVGIDKGLLGGYGQDDRVCAYTSLRALMDTEKPEYTSIVFLADKEEIGSEGNTGAKSNFIIDFVADLIDLAGSDSNVKLAKNSQKIKNLSADVNAAINPLFSEVYEKQNAPKMGSGVTLTKFTGARGKGSANDANAEFVSEIRRLFNKNDINWQIGEIGKVDEGGGGTIAKFMAQYGSDVIDCGPPVHGMHSPFEVASKGDIYSTYRAYKAFFEKKVTR